MNRGNLACFPLFALSLWISIFFSGALPGVLFPIIGLTCLAAAVTALSLEYPPWKQAGLALAFFGSAALIGGFRVPETTRWERYPRLVTSPAAYTAIPLEQVDEFRGILNADSTTVPGAEGKLSRYSMKLEQVVSADGQRRGSAAGHVLVWIQNGPMLFRGQEIRVHSKLDRIGEPGRFAYFCWAKPHQLEGGGFRKRVDSFRAGVFAAVLAKLRQLEPSVSALMGALLLGRREELHGSLYDQFRFSGSLHLLALSGLHLGILYLLLSLLLRFLWNRSVRRLAATGLVLGYVLLIGWRPSLERAAVMLLVAGLGYTLDREPQPLNLLGLAAAVLLLVHPHYAFDLSFQLSVVSLAAILILGPFLYRFWQPVLPPFVGWPLGISLSAQIGTAPLVLYHFGGLYPIGVVAAVVLIPLVAVFLGGGLLFVGLSFLPLPLSSWIAEGLFLLYRAIALCLELFSRAPGLYAPWRSLYWGFLSLLLIPLAIRVRQRRRISSC